MPLKALPPVVSRHIMTVSMIINVRTSLNLLMMFRKLRRKILKMSKVLFTYHVEFEADEEFVDCFKASLPVPVKGRVKIHNIEMLEEHIVEENDEQK